MKLPILTMAAAVCALAADPTGAEIMLLDQPHLLAILKNAKAPVFAKAKACQRLAVVADKRAIPALTPLLSDAKLGTYARYALQPIPDPAVDKALRTALGRLSGAAQLGVMNSIGYRRDAKAVKPLGKLLTGADAEAAQSAAAALGRIGNAAAAKRLQRALGTAKPPVRDAVAQASLVCAERLQAAGQTNQAETLRAALRKADVPKPVAEAVAAK
jgi:HEAT repeat protein